MVDVEARRIARRRKILENTESRLKKITGIESRVTRSELDANNFHHSSGEFNVQETSLPDIEKYCNPVDGNGDNPTYNSTITTDKNFETIFQNPRIFREEDSLSQIYNSQQQNIPRLFYILTLPVLVNLFLALCDIFQIDGEYIYLNTIFLPLIAYEIFDYIFTPNVYFSTSIISSVILLSNRPYSRELNSFVRYFVRTMQDVMIYFFVFVVSHFCVKILL